MRRSGIGRCPEPLPQGPQPALLIQSAIIGPIPAHAHTTICYMPVHMRAHGMTRFTSAIKKSTSHGALERRLEAGERRPLARSLRALKLEARQLCRRRAPANHARPATRRLRCEAGCH